MADIFISYAREDRTSAERLAKALEQQGWSVWWDPHIPAGKTFDEVIEQAIEAASCVLVLWSKHSVNSRWVRTEATEGVERGILVPVLIKEVRPPLAFRRIQAANLSDWDGKTSHPAFQKLVSDITGLLGPPPSIVLEEQSSAEEEAQDKATEAPDAQQQEPSQPGVPSTGSPSLGKMISVLGGGIAVVLLLIALMTIDKTAPVSPPVPEPKSPLVEAPKAMVTLPKPVEAPSTEPAESPVPASEPTPADHGLSQSEWKEVQRALNDIGFDAGANDGKPGAKTRYAITQYQESRGFPQSGQLSEVQRGWLLVDVRLAAEGLLKAKPKPEPAVSSAILPDMVEIPEGCFQMGSPGDEKGRYNNELQHRVCVEAFKIGKTEVTQRQWREVMGDNPSRFKDCDDCPVEQVSWHDVQDYLKKLNAKTGQRHRLPTEAEWEYAARAGTSGPFSFQGRVSADKANYDANYTYADSSMGQYRKKTVPVGSLPANPWGLHEVHGNVWEWTCSGYDENYGGSEKQCAGSDDSSYRVVRGGSWGGHPRNVRSAGRYRGTTDARYFNLGFRLAQD
ncbi:MAG: SUMF1/EgtB/PvdO family nonheme iron enzyme [Pseudomonadota bacterium]